MEWKKGLKTGAVAGVFYGIFAGIVNVVYMILMKDEVIAMIQAAIPQGISIPISMEDLYTISLISSLPSSILVGMFAGMAFGAIFLLLKGELIGKSSKFKGVFLALLLFIALGLSEMVEPGNAVGAFFQLRLSYLPLVPLSFAAFLSLGYFYGLFWDRFKKK